jgi:hypothetical protein
MAVQLIAAWLGIPLVLTLASGVSADGAPIAGVVKSVDTAAGTFVVESTSRGSREVAVVVRVVQEK